jgi:hypothetical protein
MTAMRRTSLPLSLLLSLLVASCGSDRAPATAEKDILVVIDSLETILFSDDGTMDNADAANMLVRHYAKYYQQHTADSLAIDMLFKAGEVSMGLSDGRLAVKYFTTVAEEHSGYYKAPDALFLAAFCEENLNGDIQQAEFFYSDFIAKYPDHPLAIDAAFSRENLGKSEEELIRMFEQQGNR